MEGVIVRLPAFDVYFYLELELVLDRVGILTGGVVPGFPEMFSCLILYDSKR
jgi:hypothetical protein